MSEFSLFIAEVSAYGKDGEGDLNKEEPAAIEVVGNDAEGLTLGFNDRGERMYLCFRLSELVRAIEELERK